MGFEDITNSSSADEQELQKTDVNAETLSESSDDLKSKDCSNESVEIKEQDEQFPDSVQSGFSDKLFDSEADQKLYQEVLEKLDIQKKEQNQEIQTASTANKQIQEKQESNLISQNKLENSQIQKKVEQTIAQDFQKIQKLEQIGVINSGQGQDLKKQVLKKAFDMLVQTEKIKRTISPELQQNYGLQQTRNEVFEEFNKNNPKFFIQDGRKEVLDYLKSDGVIVGKDELNKISEIIRVVEKSAIERYLKKVNHEKSLIESNEIAKQRLTANAQKSGYSDKNLSRTFTREQIGKMTSAEFAKYESLIMEQLKRGLIR